MSRPIAFQIASARGLRWMAERIMPRSVIESSVRNVFGKPEQVTQERIDRYFELNMRVGNRRALFQRLDQSESGASQHLIRQVKQPTLVLWGQRDGMVPIEFSYRFCRDIAKCTLVHFAELGHIPQEEDPAQTLKPALNFLAKP